MKNLTRLCIAAAAVSFPLFLTRNRAHRAIDQADLRIREKIILFACDPSLGDFAKCRDLRVKSEYADLERYRSLDESLPRAERRVVFFGDSITEFWSQAENSTRFLSDRYIDRGIAGQTTVQMMPRFRQDVIDLHPNTVVILAGTNDIGNNLGPESVITDNIQTMTELARDHGITVILCSILPQSRRSWITGKTNSVRIESVNAWLESYAIKEGFGYVDYYAAMSAANGSMKDGISLDGVHPNAAGYRIMDRLVQSELDKASHGVAVVAALGHAMPRAH